MWCLKWRVFFNLSFFAWLCFSETDPEPTVTPESSGTSESGSQVSQQESKWDVLLNVTCWKSSVNYFETCLSERQRSSCNLVQLWRNVKSLAYLIENVCVLLIIVYRKNVFNQNWSWLKKLQLVHQIFVYLVPILSTPFPLDCCIFFLLLIALRWTSFFHWFLPQNYHLNIVGHPPPPRLHHPSGKRFNSGYLRRLIELAGKTFSN